MKKWTAEAGSIICLANEIINPVVAKAKTVKQTWICPENSYADKNLGRRLNLLKKLFSSLLYNHHNIEAYSKHIRNMQQKSTVINFTVVLLDRAV